MKTIAVFCVLFPVSFCVGQSAMTKVERLLQSVETTKNDLEKSIADLDSSMQMGDMRVITDMFIVAEKNFNDLKSLQVDARKFLKNQHHQSYTIFGFQRLRRLDYFARERFDQERNEMLLARRKIGRFLKDSQLGSVHFRALFLPKNGLFS